MKDSANHFPIKPTKRILFFAVSSVMALIVLTFLINLVFFHKPTVIYGTNTICYTNNLNKNYHTKDCGFLNDTPATISLIDAIKIGYINCPDCYKTFDLSTIPCYITKYGDCFHNENCHYIDNSNVIMISTFNAIKNRYKPCSYCISQNTINEQCIVLPSGLYFHKTSNNSSQRNHKQLSHIISLKQYSRDDLQIKETTVYKATRRDYSSCSSCNVGMLDVSHGYTNNYLVSFLISLLLQMIIGFIIFIFYFKKEVNKNQY